MKVHQTLVWLNLLSFRTKDLTEPTIGIQSAAANHNTMLHHFDTNVPAVPAVTVILVCLFTSLLPDGRILGRWTQKWPSKIT